MTAELPPYEQVREAARGQRKDYRLDRVPFATGGQAVVFRGEHRSTQMPVAFKRLKVNTQTAVARMRREIEAAGKFGGHPHVMPVLDADSQNTWFVMPLAGETAHTVAARLTDPDRLRKLVTAVCLGLQEAHRVGWVHRDIKPDNILLLDGSWTVADWGLGKRPRGQTSDPQRTQAGTPFGTAGFAAPELSDEPHQAGPQCDVYSIGQIIGWALTGTRPRANIPLLPKPGPWRSIVRDATALNPDDRPADAEALLALITAELDSPAEPLMVRAKRLLADPNTAGALLRLVSDAETNDDLFHQVVFSLDEQQLRAVVLADPVSARLVLRSLPSDDASATWSLAVARIAEDIGEWDLVREAAESVLRLGRNENDVREWLVPLTGDAAAAVAAALRGHPDRFEDLAYVDGIDRRIAKALSAKPRQNAVAELEPMGVSWFRRQWKIISAATITMAVVVVTIIVNKPPDTLQNNSSPGNTVRRPSEAPGTPQLRDFADGWDMYPGWLACTPDTSVNGSFPSAAQAPIEPALGFSCHNGGSLTVMFGEFTSPRDYDLVIQRYRTALAVRNPFESEAQPPEDVRVFQWSDGYRGLMWTSRDARIIGVVITNSRSVDLVELWTKYGR